MMHFTHPDPPYGTVTETKPPPPPKSEEKLDSPTVADLVQDFLADCRGRLKGSTVRWYSDLLTPFAEKHGKARADAITAKTAHSYAGEGDWSNSTRHGILSALSVAFRWAGFPLVGLKKPTMESRGSKALVSSEDHAKLYEAAPPYFKPFLKLLHLTGARPSEIAAFTAENLDERQGVVCLKEHKTAHKSGKPRLIFLPPEAVAVLAEQREVHPTGHLLRNAKGRPYTKDAIVRMMSRLRKKTGVKVTAYFYRHSLATDALAKGVPDAHVAALLGHSGTTMLHKHYAHLTAKAQVLKDALGQIR